MIFKEYFFKTVAEIASAIEVLQSVRAKIANKQNTYVCCAIDDVESEGLVPFCTPACISLKRAINDHIAPALTYSGYIGGSSNPKAPKIGDGNYDEFKAWLRQERVEWIDSMIKELQGKLQNGS